MRTLALLAVLAQTIDADAVVRQIATLIEENYVDADVATKIATHLRQNAYRASDPESFAKQITDELRRLGDDRHFEVVVRNGNPAVSEDWLTPLRRRNYDFARAEWLPGNVGYLDVRSFPPPEVAGDTAAAAMAFLANTDAVIIDLRQNSGGSGDMVQFLGTYFFEQRTTMTRTYRRAENRMTDDRTLPFVPGTRMTSQDLYILTSAKTFSAAEAFAFGLQQLGRAKVVGEKTGGGANAGRYRRVDDRFSVFIPMAHAMAANSEKSWERVGVQPDIEAPADQALNVALDAIRSKPKR